VLGWLRATTGRQRRIAVLALVVILIAPAAVSALTHSENTAAGNVTQVENVTFVGVQGPFGGTGNGRVVAIDTDTRETIWEYVDDDAGENVLYYDVDPLPDDRVLFIEEVTGENATAIVVDWKTDEVLERFEVPSDTHDVDYLGNDRYAVADKFNHRAYVYDAAADEVVWEYYFANHFAQYPEAGEAPSTEPSRAGGYTHLNDIDPVDNGSAFLLSPRNFDRVVLVNRSTKETELVLGEEDNYDILHEQHNPTLVQRDPPVVLVADSENDRVVEYRRHDNGTWERTWTYTDGLHWPRDADRLPNGNTLIVDTYGQRIIEVTPDREIVWEREVPTMPYDAERLPHGDEPGGPPIDGGDTGDDKSDAGSVSPLRKLYSLSLWVLPPSIGIVEFYGLVAAVLVTLGWAGAELAVRVRRWRAAS
jgi:hypothetical protein